MPSIRPVLRALLVAAGWLVAAIPLPAAAAAPPPLEATPAALARAMGGHRVVVLGEVHDNGVQHRLRYDALAALVAGGARPAIAFEQFDRDRQSDIDRARRERPADADYLIAQAAGRGDWQWEFYRPFVQLALDHKLPIVAANLSRADATRVAREGWPAVFDPAVRKSLGLDDLPEAFRRSHEQAIAAGHCGLLPASALPAMARAQIARDIVFAQAMQPHAARGVVLLAGNGHARNDVGVPHWLDAGLRSDSVSIALLEREDDGATPELAETVDAWVLTPRAVREDPCKDLAQKMPAAKAAP